MTAGTSSAPQFIPTAFILHLIPLTLGASIFGCAPGDGTPSAHDLDGDPSGSITGGAGSVGASGGAAGVETGGSAGDGDLDGSGGAPVVTTTVCAVADEAQAAALTCPSGSLITSVDFSSYGTPIGECGAFTESAECHAVDSRTVVEAACLGKNSCSVSATNADFGDDPCSFVVKHLFVEATCTGSNPVGSGGAEPVGVDGSGGSNGTPGVWNEGAELKAFPTAEGYGRYSEGGRGGRVIKVTNLNDSGPGSLREAIEALGPRTVVFDVSGVIKLNSRLVIRKDNGFLTVAGQTAPGKGIVVNRYSFGQLGGEHVIMRFIRTRVGSSSGQTLDGMGITGAPGPVIYDHLSISWTIDEAFSSRGTIPSNFTLQRSMISECLNVAGHSNYPEGTAHGYAASISGDIGSFHHNLLAHCAGRNFSLAGGLGKNPVAFWGRLDIRNNVVYNWDNRTTDGGAHQVNFVNNYYKPGPASRHFYALTADIENFPGTQSYYFRGNVMPGHFDESNQSVGRRIVYRNRTADSVNWEVFVGQPFFPSYVDPQSATDAYHDVLSNVGVNVPVLDDHDARIIRETRDGTYTYSGSKTGKPGLPDNEADVGGLENYPTVHRPAGFDTDDDGMPNEWELAHGLDPNDPEDRNGTNLSQAGYTNLEMYLNELAGDLD